MHLLNGYVQGIVPTQINIIHQLSKVHVTDPRRSQLPGDQLDSCTRSRSGDPCKTRQICTGSIYTRLRLTKHHKQDYNIINWAIKGD